MNEVNRAGIAAARDNETVEERRRLDEEATRAARDNETEENRGERRRLDAEATRAAREAETRAETEERNLRDPIAVSLNGLIGAVILE